MFGLSKNQIDFIVTWYKACAIATIITIAAIAAVAFIMPKQAEGHSNFAEAINYLDEDHNGDPSCETEQLTRFDRLYNRIDSNDEEAVAIFASFEIEVDEGISMPAQFAMAKKPYHGVMGFNHFPYDLTVASNVLTCTVTHTE